MDLPSASTTVKNTAQAAASGVGLICVFAVCAVSADIKPRQFGSAEAAFEQHGFCEAIDYTSLHIEETGKPVLFIGLPIITQGAISREDVSGNTGSATTTITAGVNGVLAEHHGKLSVIRGGTVGTDQLILGWSLDDARNVKNIRIGTGNSYTDPYFGVSVALGAGTLVTGDTVHTWHGSAPRTDAASLIAAKAALEAQKRGVRTWLSTSEFQTHTDAQNLLDQANAYETEADRFIYARGSIKDRLPQAALSSIVARFTGAATLTFLEVGATGDTVTRSAGSWISDGFNVGDVVTIGGSVSNNVTGPIASLTATVLTFGTTDLASEGPVSGCTVVGSPGLTFAEVGATGDTVTRSRGSWFTDGFRVGDVVTFAGTASNNVTGPIASLSATVLTFGVTDLAPEVIGTIGVTCKAGQTKADWMAASEAEFSPIDAQFRISMGAGRGRKLSPFTGWARRLPVSWAASIREYQHDVMIPPWRKSDGPIGWDLNDTDENLVEWDDRVDGEAGSAARFTTFRTYSNGPDGSFIALSLTRDTDGSLLVLTHNVAVVNLACTINQLQTETSGIGRVEDLNDDGTATDAARSQLEKEVNSALSKGLLQNALGEGKRVSSAVWSANADDILNVPDATINGVLVLNLQGTVLKINTSVSVRSGGQ